MSQLKYSIIYGVVRVEISERISLGLIIVDGDRISIRYSRKKLEVLRLLLSQREYEFIQKVLLSMSRKKTIHSAEMVSYLSRYSNNLIAFSPLQAIDLEPTKGTQDWLFHNYVYAGKEKASA